MCISSLTLSPQLFCAIREHVCYNVLAGFDIEILSMLTSYKGLKHIRLGYVTVDPDVDSFEAFKIGIRLEYAIAFQQWHSLHTADHLCLMIPKDLSFMLYSFAAADISHGVLALGVFCSYNVSIVSNLRGVNG